MVIRMLLSMVVLGLMIVGCSKDDSSTGPGDTRFTGTSFLRAKVGSLDFKCNELTKMSTEIAPTVTVESVGDGKLRMEVDGSYYSMSGAADLTLNVVIETAGAKEYSLTTSLGDVRMYSMYNDGVLANTGFYSAGDGSGTITIDHVDVTAKRIAGRFTATLPNSDPTKSSTLQITNGTFEIGY